MIMGNVTLHFDQLMFIWSDTYGFYWEITAFRYNSSLINGFEVAEKLGDTAYEKCYSIEFRELLSQILLSLFCCSVVSNSLWPHGLQHARPPCPLPSPRAYPNSCSLSQWCHPTISSFVIPFFSYLQSFPASGSLLMSQLFASGGQSIGTSASASVLPIQDWFPLGLTCLITLQFKGLSRDFSNTTVQKHPYFSAQLSLFTENYCTIVPNLIHN